MMRHREDFDSSKGISLSLDLKTGFKFGRTTALTCEGNPALPNPEVTKPCKAVEDNFVTNLGLSWTGATALMGVHTIGRAEARFSGYDGPWNGLFEARRFTNSYYKSMLAAGWKPQTNPWNPAKHQWVRSDLRGRNSNEMMLNTDMCLLYDTPHNCNAALDNCCAWTDDTPSGLNNTFTRCGGLEANTADCCFNSGSELETCNDELDPKGAFPAGAESAAAVKLFANDEGSWLSEFITAWRVATTLGDFSSIACPPA
jgi:hypothetical protein